MHSVPGSGSDAEEESGMELDMNKCISMVPVLLWVAVDARTAGIHVL